MDYILFPQEFPTIEAMMADLKKTFEKSWKVELDIEDVNKWLENFNGSFLAEEDEKRLALWLLCYFTYYNKEEVNHLCAVLYKNFMHKIMTDRSVSRAEEFEELMKSIYFTSIGNASESGGMLLYHFRQQADLSIDRFVFPTVIPLDCDVIVCIDDVMMSGGTAARFFHQHKKMLEGKIIYYLTLITSQEAVEKLEGLGITVICCEKLDARSKIFSEESLCFYKFPQLREAAFSMVKGYGERIEPKKPLGHNEGQYSFGFYYNIPNNSLPIFWSSNDWHPILARKEKYQNAKQVRRKYDYYL